MRNTKDTKDTMTEMVKDGRNTNHGKITPEPSKSSKSKTKTKSASKSGLKLKQKLGKFAQPIKFCQDISFFVFLSLEITYKHIYILIVINI